MKKFITAFLPFILIAQLPISASKLVPADWMKSVHYGLKWTELMMNGYPGAEPAEESVPDGYVTTTVTLARAIADSEAIRAALDEYLCDVDYREELALHAGEVVKLHMDLQKTRLQEIRVRVVRM